MTVNELLAAALGYEESLLAHSLYCGLMDGVISGTDLVNEQTYSLIDLDKAKSMKDQNVLGIQFMRLYSAPLGNSLFAMFFAPDEEKAKQLYKKEFKQNCKKMYLVDHGMDISTYCLESKKHQTWRELRDSLPVLPAYVGVFQK